MWFWIRYLLIAVILIIGVTYFLLGNDAVFDIKKSKNAAAEGLSRFYSLIRDQNKENKDRDLFVLQLDTPEYTLDRVLAERTRTVEPMSKYWTGEVISRRFKSGSTLKSELSQHADNEGISLYWYLDKDYVVKGHFRIEGDFNAALYRVGRGINDSFEYEVYTYLCYKQRAAVITVLPSEFVRSNCLKLNK